MAANCSVKLIKFKTKRGKVVTFKGRPGGDEKHGGSCGHKRRKVSHSAAAKAARHAFKVAVKACKGKSKARKSRHAKSAFNTCISHKV